MGVGVADTLELFIRARGPRIYFFPWVYVLRIWARLWGYLMVYCKERCLMRAISFLYFRSVWIVVPPLFFIWRG